MIYGVKLGFTYCKVQDYNVCFKNIYIFFLIACVLWHVHVQLLP